LGAAPVAKTCLTIRGSVGWGWGWGSGVSPPEPQELIAAIRINMQSEALICVFFIAQSST
jgi:hypothetical protein